MIFPPQMHPVLEQKGPIERHAGNKPSEMPEPRNVVVGIPRTDPSRDLVHLDNDPDSQKRDGRDFDKNGQEKN